MTEILDVSDEEGELLQRGSAKVHVKCENFNIALIYQA